MVLTPRFSVTQTATHVQVHVVIPNVRVSGMEVTVVESNDFSFYCRPYLLRLTLPGLVCDEEDVDESKRPRAQYDPNRENGTVTIQLTKLIPNESFEGLDMLTSLLKVGAARPRVGKGRYGLGVDGAGRYGFANGFQDFFGADGFLEEFPDLIDLPHPDETPRESRTALRMMHEDAMFSGERYRADLFRGKEDYLYHSAWDFTPDWSITSSKAKRQESPKEANGDIGSALESLRISESPRIVLKPAAHGEPSAELNNNEAVALKDVSAESQSGGFNANDGKFAQVRDIPTTATQNNSAMPTASGLFTSGLTPQKGMNESSGLFTMPTPSTVGTFVFGSPQQATSASPTSTFIFGSPTLTSPTSTFIFNGSPQQTTLSSPTFIFNSPPTSQNSSLVFDSSTKTVVFGQREENANASSTQSPSVAKGSSVADPSDPRKSDDHQDGRSLSGFFNMNETKQLSLLGPREFTVESTRNGFLKILDVLLAFCYENRMCSGDFTVESHWTIRKLSATLSWLEEFESMDEVFKSFSRRCLCFPYLRRWDLCYRAALDCRDLLGDPRWILRALLKVQDLLNQSGTAYLLNKLFIDDMCVWVQTPQNRQLIRERVMQEARPALKEWFNLAKRVPGPEMIEWNLAKASSSRRIDDEILAISHLPLKLRTAQSSSADKGVSPALLGRPGERNVIEELD